MAAAATPSAAEGARCGAAGGGAESAEGGAALPAGVVLTRLLQDVVPGLQLAAEAEQPLLTAAGLRVKRIVSTGQATPAGEWYEQDDHELCVVLAGSGSLVFEGRKEPVRLLAGDALYLPRGVRHRVESTSTTEPTVWLALHHDGPAGLAVAL